MKNKCLLFVILLFFSLESYTWASVELVFPLEEIIIKSRKVPSSFELSPFRTTIYHHEHKGMFKTTAEIIGRSLGAQVRSTGGLGQVETLSIRGVNSSQVAVFLDGVRLNALGGGGFDLSLIPIEFLEKIDIFRGGFSAEYGLDALGGVLRLKTKIPQGKTKCGFSWSTGSSRTNHFNLSALTSFQDANLLVQMQCLASRGDYLFVNDQATQTKADDKIEKRENNYSRSQNLCIKLTKNPLKGKEINYLLQMSRVHRGVAGLITFPSDSAFEKKLLIVNGLSIRCPWKKTEVKFDLSYKYSTMYFLDKDGDLTGAKLETDQKERSINTGLRIKLPINNNNFFSAKYEYSHQVLEDINFGKPYRNINSVLLKEESLFFKDKLFLSSRLRFDLINDNQLKNTLQANPHIGIFYKFNKKVKVKSNLGRSYRIPNFSELYLNQGLIIGNVDLKSERAWHYDIGLTFKIGKIKGEASYFYENLKDAIQFVLISGFRFKPLNVSRANISGLEFGGQININKYLLISLGYTYLKAIDKTGKPNQDGNQLVGRPKHKLDLSCDFCFNKGKIFLDFGLLSGNYLTQANTKLLPRRASIDLGAVFEIKRNISFGVDIKNILNRYDYDIRGFPLPGRTFFTTLSFNK